MALGNTFIKVYRSVMNNWIWSEKPYDMAHAWIDLLLRANFVDKQNYFRGQVFLTQRGQVHTSIRELSERWGWPEKRARRFISLLKAAGMVQVEGSPRGTTITIENYSSFQSQGRTEGQANDRVNDRVNDRMGDQTHPSKPLENKGSTVCHKKEKKERKKEGGGRDVFASENTLPPPEDLPPQIDDVLAEWERQRQEGRR